MLKLYGKFIARWTGTDGKRHSKACPTMRAAKKLQKKMLAERLGKKAKRPATSAKSSRRSSATPPAEVSK